MNAHITHGIGRPDAADLSQIVVEQLAALAAGQVRIARQVDPGRRITNVPTSAIEVAPGDPQLIEHVAVQLDGLANQLFETERDLAQQSATAHRVLAATLASVQAKTASAYEIAGRHGVETLLLSDGKAMAEWLENHPSARDEVGQALWDAIQARLEWSDAHAGFIEAHLPHRQAWGIADW